MMMYDCTGSIAVSDARAGAGRRVATPEASRQDGPIGTRLGAGAGQQRRELAAAERSWQQARREHVEDAAHGVE